MDKPRLLTEPEIAESRGERAEIVKRLLEAGADRTLRDRNSRTAGDRVAAGRDEEVWGLLQ